MTCKSGLYRRLFTSAQNIGTDPLTCTKLIRSFPSTLPRRNSPLGGIGSNNTICSVSLKFDTFPWASIPREKYRVPARCRDRREMRRKRRSRLLSVVWRSSIARYQPCWTSKGQVRDLHPYMTGKMKRLNCRVSQLFRFQGVKSLTSTPPFSVRSIILFDKNLFQKNLSSARFQAGHSLTPLP